ncbi:GH3 domain-containing protein [Trichinella spiralis]|uniref:GH3 domain-containing protein n=1 Tax=Trichinella spiralis TaxID=6334 RepID=A0ABR3K1T7_TRISP
MEIIDRILENSKVNRENRQHFENVQRILYTLFNWCDSVGMFVKSGGSAEVVNVVGQLFVDFVAFFEKSIENEMALLELNDTNIRSNVPKRTFSTGDGINEETDILLSDVREMEPMMLNLSRETLACLKFGAIVDMLKKWSECEDVAFRSVNIESDRDDRFMISAYGTLQARRRLQNILLSAHIEQWLESGECNCDVDEIAWL